MVISIKTTFLRF